MVSVSHFEVILFESDVCFGCVVVVTCDGQWLGRLLMIAGSFPLAGMCSFVGSRMSCCYQW